MNGLRTEQELRSALRELSEDAPQAADVLPSTTSREPGRREMRRLAPVAAAAAVLAVALGLTQPWQADTPSGGDPHDLIAITWQLQTVDGKSAAGRLAMKIEPNGRFWQNLGSCSSLAGQVTVTPTQLRVDHVRLSLGLCPVHGRFLPADTVRGLRTMFTGTISWTVADSRLTLRKHGAPTLTYTLPPHLPAHSRRWTYRGVGISLPASWPRNAVRCGDPTENTVIYPGPVSTCDLQPPPRVTSVQFSANQVVHVAAKPSTTVIDGVPAIERIGLGGTAPYAGLHVIEIRFPSRHATVTIAAPSQAEALRLQSQVYLTGR